MKLEHLKQFEEYYWVQDEDESRFDLTITQEEYATKILNALNIPHSTISHLADGGYGVAIDLGNDTVLKITTNTSEAFYAKKLMEIDSINLIKVYDVHQIESQYQYGTLYSIHMEKLNTNLVGVIKHVVDYLHKRNPITPKLDNGIPVTTHDVVEFFEGKLVGMNEDNIMLIYNKWLNVYNACKDNEIPIDDFHSKNVGTSKRNAGELVFFDVSSLYEIRETNIDTIPKISLV